MGHVNKIDVHTARVSALKRKLNQCSIKYTYSEKVVYKYTHLYIYNTLILYYILKQYVC